MMNKIITTTLLLAAGTALASAASVVTTTVSFEKANSASVGRLDWKKDSTDGYYVGTELSSKDMFSAFSWGAMTVEKEGAMTKASMIMNQVNMNDRDNPISGALNLGTIVPHNDTGTMPGSYGLTFSFTAAQDVSISSLGFSFVGAMNGGSFEAAKNTKSENTSIKLSSNGSELESLTNHMIYGTSENEVKNGLPDSKASNNVSLDFNPITLKAGETLSFTLNVEQSGLNTGLKNISIKASAVPEPSAFGLLAGLGALALVASRRRRSRKAA